MSLPIDIPWGPNQSYPHRNKDEDAEEEQPLIQDNADHRENEIVEAEPPQIQEHAHRQEDEIVEVEELDNHVQVASEDISETSDQDGNSSREGCFSFWRATGMMELGNLICVTIPFFVTNILLYSRSMVSLYFLGGLGKVELAGGALALAFGNLSGFSVITGFSAAMDPIVAHAFGAERWAVINRAYLKTVCLVMSVSILISYLWLNAEQVLLLLSQDAEIIKVAKAYLVYMIPELFAQAHLNPLKCLLRCQGRTAALAIASSAALLIHTAANYLLIKRLNMGVMGVAVALGGTTVLLNMILMVRLIFSDSAPHPWNSGTFQFFRKGWRQVFALAITTAVAVCFEWWSYEFILIASGFLDNPQTSIAATGILIQTSGFLYIFPFSLSAMLTTRVGTALGANRPSHAKLVTISGIISAFVYGILALVITLDARSVWGKIFTGEPQILAMISSALPLLGICELGNSLQTVASGVLAGTARPKTVALIYFCLFYVIGASVALLLIFRFGLGFRGLWLGLASAQASAACTMLCILFFTDWKREARDAKERMELAARGDSGLEENLLSSRQLS